MYIYYSISYEFAVLIIQNTCHEGIEMFRKDENDITSGDIQGKKETAELEYASLYDDDQAPTEEEQKQLQAEHEENERLEKKQILQQRNLKKRKRKTLRKRILKRTANLKTLIRKRRTTKRILLIRKRMFVSPH